MYPALRKQCDNVQCNRWAVGFVRIQHVADDGYKLDIDRPYCSIHKAEMNATMFSVEHFDTLAGFREDRYDR